MLLSSTQIYIQKYLIIVSVAVRLEFCSTIGVRGAGEFKGFGGGDDGGWVSVDGCDA